MLPVSKYDRTSGLLAQMLQNFADVREHVAVPARQTRRQQLSYRRTRRSIRLGLRIQAERLEGLLGNLVVGQPRGPHLDPSSNSRPVSSRTASFHANIPARPS